ncbi:MAG: aldo/keto reductase [Anaerolineae bacterium]|nr:aldo/keto reductase [Anaerolineae bacterium]
MEYKLLGRTGVTVSQLCFGTMSFGDTADEKMSEAMYKRCREIGINFFDCADVYAGGRSEEILGKLMANERDELVITSKVASPVDGGSINKRGYSRRHVMRQVEKSLKRLNTDRIDIYFLHHYDPTVPIEEAVRALDDLVTQGKILYPAVSNWSAWQTAQALKIAEYEGLARIEVLQPMYNLVKRQAEVEIFPLAQYEDIAVIPYSPLGGGLLTGKYGKNKKPDSGRIVDSQMYTKRYSEESYYETAENFTAYAQEKGYHPATLAVAWAMAHPSVTAPIIGARNLDQLKDSLAALNVDMTPEWRAEMSALSYTPPLANDRLEEQIG